MSKSRGRKNVISDPFDFMIGGGDMGQLMRSLVWDETPLGSPDTWPQSLRSALSICLNSRFPIAIYWGTDLVLLYNDAWSPILGAKHPWGLGRPARDAWSEIWHIIGPMFEQVRETGEATWRHDELLPMERHGYLEECYFDYTFSPIRAEDGTIGGIFNAVVETTTRVVGERRLKTLRDLGTRATQARTVKESCLTVATILGENTADIPFALLYLPDEDATEVELFAASQLDEAGPARRKILSLIDEETSGFPIARAVKTRTTIVVDDVKSRFGDLPRGPWSHSPREAVVLPMYESTHGRLTGVLVFGVSPARALDSEYRGFFDLVAGQAATAISNARAYEEERRRAEKLAELDRTKTAFFSNVSHEFRTPLTLMLGPLQDILDKPDDQVLPENRALIEVVNRNALRLQKLVNTLLDFSRIESGRIRANYTPIDIAHATSELASVFQSAVERAGMRLIVACESFPEPVYLDRDMWEKIVLNLVSNAFKFTLEGEIEVTLEREDDFAVLRVRDTGSGISQEQLPHIFERFHRVEGVRARTEEGTGIGLALVQELVKIHGGAVGVESRLGHGTTFTIRIPLGTRHLPGEQIGAPARGSSTSLAAGHFVNEALKWNADVDDAGPFPTEVIKSGEERARVLVADDNADMREYLVRLLSSRYRVEAVTDGEAALQAARVRPPDLVLTDVMMPKLGGFELLWALRADPKTSGIPVIMLSARAGEEARIEGLEAGADDYLVKPFSAREVVARVGGAIALATARREALRREEELRAEIRSVLESITDGFLAVDKNWRITYVNKAAEQVYEGPRSDYFGRDFWETFPGVAESFFGAEYRRAMQERISIQVEGYYEPFDSWFDVTVYPVDDGGLALYFRNTTDRVRAVLALNRSEERFRALVTASSDVVYCMSPDWAEMQPLDGRGFVSDNSDSIRNWMEKNVPQHEHARVAEAIRVAIAGKEPLELEHQVLLVDGTIGWTHSRAIPLLDSNGEILEWFGTASNITHRKRVEDDLARVRAESDRRRRLYETFLENTPDLAYVLDTNHRFIYANEEVLRTWGRSWDESIGKTYLDVGYEPWLADLHDREIEHVKRTKKTVRGEAPFTGTTGRRIYEYIFVPVLGPDGDVEAITGTTRDVTERRHDEESLRASEAKLRFLARVEDETRALADADSLTAVTARLLGDYLEVDRCAYASIEDESIFVITGDYVRDVPSIVGRWPIAAFGHECTRSMLANEPYVVTDTDSDPRITSNDLIAYRAATIRAVICVPLHKSGVLTAAVAVHQKEPRAWTPEEIELVQFVVSRCWESLERARVAESLRESEERFRLFMEHSPASAWITDLEGRIEYLSPSYLRMFQIPDDAVGRSAFELYSPELGRQHLANIQAVARSGRVLEVIEDGVLRDGTIGKFLVYKFPLSLRGREVVGGVAVDITARLAAERALAESEERYRTLAENVQQLFWTWRPDGQCDYLSRRWIEYTGISEAEQLGLAWIERVIHPDDRDRTLEIWTEAVEDRGPYDVNHRIRAADGSYRWYKARGTAIRDQDGSIVKWFGTCTDIDAQVNAEVALRDADRKKDEFLAMLAHELRNPLSAIGNAIQLSARSDAKEHQEWSRGVIQKQVGSLSRMIDDLLDVSRITRGKIVLRRECLDVSTMISHAVDMVRPLVQEKKHALTISNLSATPALVVADPQRLEQILVNLLTNAAKYTEPGGRISVTVRSGDDSVAISIADNGSGIPAGKIPEMFELFAQGDRSIARSEGGLGIGLTLVQRLVEMHGGSVSAKSDGVGLGSEFTVRLPALATGTVMPQRTPPGDSTALRTKRRVLVVDDNQDSAIGLARLLRVLGNEVEVTHDGPSAIEAAHRMQPNYVLLDIGLPGMDGYEVAKKLRAGGFANSTIIAVSGYGEAAAQKRSREAGFDHHMVKPLDYEKLVALLAKSGAADGQNLARSK